MIPSGVKVFLASHPVDFRKGPDSLLSLVRDAGSDPFNGALYVFRAKRADRVKIVWWDGSGVCLYAKRLEKSQFCWPRIGHNRVQLNHAQLLALIDGMDWKRVRSVPVKPPVGEARLPKHRRRAAGLCLRGDRDRHRCDQGAGQQGRRASGWQTSAAAA
ncbi:transposase [Sinorhizobium fredii]